MIHAAVATEPNVAASRAVRSNNLLGARLEATEITVQPLHVKRGRSPSTLLRVYEEEFPDKARRTHYYHHARMRVWCALVEAGLMDKAPRVRGERWPLPLPVMHQIGKRSRIDAEVSWLAQQALALRQRGWTTPQLVFWLRNEEGAR